MREQRGRLLEEMGDNDNFRVQNGTSPNTRLIQQLPTESATMLALLRWVSWRILFVWDPAFFRCQTAIGVKGWIPCLGGDGRRKRLNSDTAASFGTSDVWRVWARALFRLVHLCFTGGC